LKGNFKTFLVNTLSKEEIVSVYKSYDILGDLAIIRVPESLQRCSQTIAEAIMKTHRHVKAVWCQTSPVSGNFRLRTLEWVAGERRTEAIHKEYGCVFKVDLAHCYFSPRLSYERMRIAKQVRAGEVIVNMFAGVGCFSIIIARQSKAEKIYSIDINPKAIEYMRENIRLNKVEEKVIPVQGDSKQIIQERLQNIAERVLMPLPELAYEYLDCALSALKSNGERWIHYYDFTHAEKDESPIKKIKAKISNKLRDLGVNFEMPFSRVVRTTGPNWYQIIVDILVKK
jgi:tRNA (guanine37-N1)-methyltransferase